MDKICNILKFTFLEDRGTERISYFATMLTSYTLSEPSIIVLCNPESLIT